MVRGWVLLEQPGPWGRDAVTESRLDPDLARALDRAAAAAHLRLLLIRRPGRAARETAQPHTCFVAHTSRAGRWLERRRLDDPAELLELDMARVVAGERPGFGEEVTEPVYLVCTNGRHDRCCATYGRPLALALQASHGELVWESSHVGGDRFAGNLVCLPGGHYFGRVGPGRRRAGGRPAPQGHHRPRPLPGLLRRPAGRPGGRVVRPLPDRPDRRRRPGAWPAATGWRADLHAVRFRRPGGGVLRVLVRATRTADPRLLTCHSALPEPPMTLRAARAGRRARALAAQAASSATLGCTVRP